MCEGTGPEGERLRRIEENLGLYMNMGVKYSGEESQEFPGRSQGVSLLIIFLFFVLDFFFGGGETLEEAFRH